MELGHSKLAEVFNEAYHKMVTVQRAKSLFVAAFGLSVQKCSLKLTLNPLSK